MISPWKVEIDFSCYCSYYISHKKKGLGMTLEPSAPYPLEETQMANMRLFCSCSQNNMKVALVDLSAEASFYRRGLKYMWRLFIMCLSYTNQSPLLL